MPRFALWLGCVVLFAAPGSLKSADLKLESREKPSSPPLVTSLPRVSPELSAALQDRRFAEAIRLIDGELKKPDVAAADYLLYLRGRAQTELKLYEPAIDTFRKLETEHPQSGWASRARFGHAEVFIRQRNYQQAGEIYEREAARLLSAGRRDELFLGQVFAIMLVYKIHRHANDLSFAEPHAGPSAGSTPYGTASKLRISGTSFCSAAFPPIQEKARSDKLTVAVSPVRGLG